MNLQNANNNANNENMATAGRRRTLKRLEKLKNFATNVAEEGNDPGIRVGFKPIRIKHLKRAKRKEEDLEVVAEEASIVALAYVDLFLTIEKLKKEHQTVSVGCLKRMFCCTAKAASVQGSLGVRLSQVFSSNMPQLLQFPANYISNAQEDGIKMYPCRKFHCEMKRLACD